MAEFDWNSLLNLGTGIYNYDQIEGSFDDAFQAAQGSFDTANTAVTDAYNQSLDTYQGMYDTAYGDAQDIYQTGLENIGNTYAQGAGDVASYYDTGVGQVSDIYGQTTGQLGDIYGGMAGDINALYGDAYTTTQETLSPYNQAGQQALADLQGMGDFNFNYDNYLDSDNYQWLMDQTTQATERGAAAKNSLFSGNTLQDLNRDLTQVAGREYGAEHARQLSEYTTNKERQGTLIQAGLQAGMTQAQIEADLTNNQGRTLASLAESYGGNLSQLGGTAMSTLGSMSSQAGSNLASLATSAGNQYTNMGTAAMGTISSLTEKAGTTLADIMSKYGNNIADIAIGRGAAITGLSMAESQALAAAISSMFSDRGGTDTGAGGALGGILDAAGNVIGGAAGSLLGGAGSAIGSAIGGTAAAGLDSFLGLANTGLAATTAGGAALESAGGFFAGAPVYEGSTIAAAQAAGTLAPEVAASVAETGTITGTLPKLEIDIIGGTPVSGLEGSAYAVDAAGNAIAPTFSSFLGSLATGFGFIGAVSALSSFSKGGDEDYNKTADVASWFQNYGEEKGTEYFNQMLAGDIWQNEAWTNWQYAITPMIETGAISEYYPALHSSGSEFNIWTGEMEGVHRTNNYTAYRDAREEGSDNPWGEVANSIPQEDLDKLIYGEQPHTEEGKRTHAGEVYAQLVGSGYEGDISKLTDYLFG